MSAEDKAREIVNKHKCGCGCCDFCQTVDHVPVDYLIPHIAHALREEREEGRQEGIRNKCQLIAECKAQWIEECARVAEEWGYKYFGVDIAEAIRKRGEG